MERFCKPIKNLLWDSTQADQLISRAAQIVDSAAEGNFDRDQIRTEPFTNKVVEQAQRHRYA
jgi:hypothetical protein